MQSTLYHRTIGDLRRTASFITSTGLPVVVTSEQGEQDGPLYSVKELPPLPLVSHESDVDLGMGSAATKLRKVTRCSGAVSVSVSVSVSVRQLLLRSAELCVPRRTSVVRGLNEACNLLMMIIIIIIIIIIMKKTNQKNILVKRTSSG